MAQVVFVRCFLQKMEVYILFDCGMNIHQVSPMLRLFEENCLLAHSDAYPSYKWKLNHQFSHSNEVFDKLSQKYDLSVDYFQSTILLYDTSIIEETTFSDLYNLSNEFPISQCNEQGIMSLYFTNIKPLWKQIPIHNNEKSIYYYDFIKRSPHHNYIMNKR